MNKLVRSTVGLREALFEEWEALREGKSNPTRARSVSALANTILQSVQVEIDYHKYVTNVQNPSPKKSIGFDGTKIQLGESEKEKEAA